MGGERSCRLGGTAEKRPRSASGGGAASGRRDAEGGREVGKRDGRKQEKCLANKGNSDDDPRLTRFD
ncbi:unnamed protein product [Bubo scandiacus]